MRALVTNDDGIDAPGLWHLARAVRSTGIDVVVAAPQRDMSGQGAAIGGVHLNGSIGVEERQLDGLDGVPCYAVDGTPAVCVIAASVGAFGPAHDVVVSGINPGPNTGAAVLHSGTVGAALTGANFGASGMAVSMAFGKHLHWETPAALSIPVLEWLLEQPPRTVVNLNTPNLPLADILGVEWGDLAAFGSVRAALSEVRDGRVQLEFVGQRDDPDDTDAGLIGLGYASLTLLSGPRALTPVASLADAVAGALFDRSA